MSPTVATSYEDHSNSPGFFAITRTRVAVVLTLIATCIIASLLPDYRQTIKDAASFKYHNAIEHLPAVKVDWHPAYDPKTQYNATKLAIMVEGRPLPQLVPQLLHMIAVVPPDWRFMFIGTNQSVVSISRSFATKYHEANGKLDLVVLPKPFSIENKEHVYRLFTNPNFYEKYTEGVEWMLKFDSSSILCANSNDSLNDWLEYDWAGAPRTADDKFAGKGGLSLRRISKVRQILGFQTRYDNTEPEDEWFGRRITNLPGAEVATGADGKAFSVEDTWHAKPMGFHVRQGGENLPDDVWKDPKRRKQNFEYCPELSMIMPMKLERERCKGDDLMGNLDPANAKDNYEGI